MIDDGKGMDFCFPNPQCLSNAVQRRVQAEVRTGLPTSVNCSTHSNQLVSVCYYIISSVSVEVMIILREQSKSAVWRAVAAPRSC